MSADGYLFFPGNCAEAMAFYEQALGAQIQRRVSYGEMPEAHEPGWEDKIAHAYLNLLGSGLMASDAPPGHYTAPAGFRICLNVDDAEHAKLLFTALAQGGSAEMEPVETSWSPLFAMVTDRFAIPWMINVA